MSNVWLKAGGQMIRAMYDSHRLIGRFAQDDSRKNGDDWRTDGDDSYKRDFLIMYLLNYLLVIQLYTYCLYFF